MPNMFGGDQFHPAYNPETKLAENQMFWDNDLITVDLQNDTFTREPVSGGCWRISLAIAPKEIRDFAETLRKKGA